jgi:hypothetical protein
MVDHDEFGPIDAVIETDLTYASPRGGAAHRHPPQTAVDRQVVDVAFASGELGQSFDSVQGWFSI